MPELARQLFSRLKKKESATSKKVAPVASTDGRCLKQAWGSMKQTTTAKEMTSAPAKASLEMHPVMPQQGVSGEEQFLPGSNKSFDQGCTLKFSASAQDRVGGDPDQDAETEKKEVVPRRKTLRSFPQHPQKDVSRESFSPAGLCPSSQKEQQRLQADNESGSDREITAIPRQSDSDREIGSNLAPADIPGNPADVHGGSLPDANVGMEVEPQLPPSKTSSYEEGHFFSGPAPTDLQECAAQVRALVAAGKVIPAREGAEEKLEKKEEEDEQEEAEDEEEAHERKMEDMERRLEDWHVYWKMPPMQKVQIRCLLGLRPFP